MPRVSIVQGVLNGSVLKRGSLNDPTIDVDPGSESVTALVEDLRDTMWSYDICVGLAAPQIGSNLRVAVINPTRQSRAEDLVLINPRIIGVSGKKDVKRESCMSLWGWQGDVERRSRVEVSFVSTEGVATSQTFDGFLARVVQHEIDHLDGTLYVQKLRSGAELGTSEIFDNSTPDAPETTA